MSTYAGQASDLQTWLTGAEINRDRNLRLQYLAGLQLNSSTGAGAYGEMMAYRKFPDDLFVATPARLKELRQALAGTR